MPDAVWPRRGDPRGATLDDAHMRVLMACNTLLCMYMEDVMNGLIDNSSSPCLLAYFGTKTGADPPRPDYSHPRVLHSTMA